MPIHTLPTVPNLIQDHTLADLSRPDHPIASGIFSSADQAFLAIAIPEIAAELLQLRAATRSTDQADPTQNVNSAVKRQIARAFDAICDPDGVPPGMLIAACETVARLSHDQEQIDAAQATLASMRAGCRAI